MKKSKLWILAVLVILAMMTVGLRQASAILYTGSINYPAGISATLEWANSGTSLSWNINYVGQNASDQQIWHYEYTFNVGGTKGDLSHLVLQVTDDADSSEFFNFTNALIAGPETYVAGTPPNWEMPLNLYGIKFSTDGDWGLNVTFGFDSIHSPVWGNFYARDGVNGYAYNTGLLTETDGNSLLRYDLSVDGNGDGMYVLTANGVTVGPPVPIPAAAWLLGSGLLGLVVIRRRMKK